MDALASRRGYSGVTYNWAIEQSFEEVKVVVAIEEMAELGQCVILNAVAGVAVSEQLS